MYVWVYGAGVGHVEVLENVFTVSKEEKALINILIDCFSHKHMQEVLN